MMSAAWFVSPSATARAKAPCLGDHASASMEKPKSLGS